MAMTDEQLSLEQINKGAYRGYMIFGNIVELWFSSPTGDSTDTVRFEMHCTSPEQAHDIAAMHQRVWGHC
ncbi:MAG: hypothetical protein EBS91_00240 [Betaproteobacteria bacterium]|nr:hypothetical protein [Betaproteobacteria bacterium]NCA23064.1 hypothetical protein [Betaproteobacteria bacterium]